MKAASVYRRHDLAVGSSLRVLFQVLHGGVPSGLAEGKSPRLVFSSGLQLPDCTLDGSKVMGRTGGHRWPESRIYHLLRTP